MATHREADELFIAAERKGVLKAADYVHWNAVLGGIASINLGSNQSETAKQCYLSLLGQPRLNAIERINVLQGLAIYHKERKEWVNVSKCCEEALTLLPKAKDGISNGLIEEIRLLLLLADAAEGDGNMRRARYYDKTAKRVWSAKGMENPLADFATSSLGRYSS